LDRAERISDAKCHCENYAPALVEHAPSERYSPEFLRFKGWIPADTRKILGYVFVPQSEGRASGREPLVSVAFTRCSAIVVRNIDSKESLLMHHDSGARSSWAEYRHAVWGARASPETPKRRLLGKDRFGYVEFMKRPGRKQAILVDSRRAPADRLDAMRQIRAEGAVMLPTLKINTDESGSEKDKSVWQIVYRPESGDLIVHVMDSSGAKVMHFPDIFSSGKHAAI
jgi:hypothetical protein